MTLNSSGPWVAFALTGFSYGCIDLSGNPISCVITLSGKKTTGTRTIQTDNYSASGSMKTLSLSSGWSRLTSVEFSQKIQGGIATTSNTPVLIIDTVFYTLTNSTA